MTSIQRERKRPWTRLRLGRSAEPSRNRTAFVLSGGGTQGSIQVGMLTALMETGISPDLVIGTSVGALNGAVLAQEPNEKGIEQLKAIWENLDGEDVFPGSRLGRAWKMVRGGDHVFPRDGLVKIVEDNIRRERFEDLPIQLKVIACDLDTGEELVFKEGPIKPALLASTALPGVFPPLSHDGRRLIDGGVVNNVPVSIADAPGVSEIYVLNVSAEVDGKEIKHPLDVLVQAFAIAKSQRWLKDLDNLATNPKIHVLPRPAFEPVSFDDLSQSMRLMEEAYELTRSYLGSVAA